eukprot:m.139078 g.139078  ORF g.139078 m.139078 type:complete len:245 (+) comp18803_c0_seq1:130-864(+)
MDGHDSESLHLEIEEEPPSCLVISSFYLSNLAVICILVAIFVPSLILQNLSVPVNNTESNYTVTIGRGLLQMSIYNNHGEVALYSYFSKDIYGMSVDPFCGGGNLSSTLPFVNVDIIGKTDERNWCKKRVALLGFCGLLTALLCLAVVCLFLEVHCCANDFHFLMTIGSTIPAIISLCIIAAYRTQLIFFINGQPLQERMFPFHQRIVYGPSFYALLVGFLLVIVIAVLSLMNVGRRHARVLAL